MSMLLVHELHEARDRILLLKQRLQETRQRELPTYLPTFHSLMNKFVS